MIRNVFIRSGSFLTDWYDKKLAKKYLFTGNNTLKTKDTNLPRILHTIGFFSSISEARRAGYDGETENGWKEYYIGARKYVSIYRSKRMKLQEFFHG